MLQLDDETLAILGWGSGIELTALEHQLEREREFSKRRVIVTRRRKKPEKPPKPPPTIKDLPLTSQQLSLAGNFSFLRFKYMGGDLLLALSNGGGVRISRASVSSTTGRRGRTHVRQVPKVTFYTYPPC